MNKPNILFIMTDEQCYNTLGVNNSFMHTPNIDALASDGINFDRAYTSSPSCVPARAAIFTGKFPERCQCLTYTSCLPEQEKTFMSYLREAGYFTAVIGKQHFGRTAMAHGYDYEDIIDCHMPDKILERYTPKVNSYIRYLLDEGFSDPSQLYEPLGNFHTYKWKEDLKYHIDCYVADKAIEYVKSNLPKERPWFFCVSFPGPHQPYDAIGTGFEKYYPLDAMQMPETNSEHLASKTPLYHKKGMDQKSKKVSELTIDEIKLARQSYYANMSLIDMKIGQLLKVLKEQGLYEDTMIIFTTDHGDFMGEFGFLTKGQYLSEALMHIPFIVKPPIKGFEGLRSKELISTVDIGASCLAAANLPIPKDMQGIDLTSLWNQDRTYESRHSLYMEAGEVKCVRTYEYKLVYYSGRSYGELYNLMKDPYEKHNFWDKPEYLAIKDELKSELLMYMVRNNPLWDTLWAYQAPSI